MTVCVAAIATYKIIYKNAPLALHSIIGASDRMLTAYGDIEFEPERPKIFPLTSSIVIMLAGDSSLQDEILPKIYSDVYKRIEVEPNNWWNVRDVADLYSRYYNESLIRRAEKNILVPLGLDSSTFISRQKEMNSEFVLRIANQLQSFQIPKVETIFAGIDKSGAHIYAADNEGVNCYNSIGFAAIGVGTRHASSQMMVSGHTLSKPVDETLWSVYSSKKRAEVAPGVGKGTDMFMIGPKLGSYKPIGKDVIDKLDKIYKETVKREKSVALKSIKTIKKSLKKLFELPIREEQTTKSKKDETISIDKKDEKTPPKE